MSAQPTSMRVFDDDATWLRLGAYCPSCGKWVSREASPGHQAVAIPPRLWVYTNYDCNLTCRYCLVSSSPWADRRGIGLDRFTTLVGQAIQLGIDELFLTGGEPFLVPEIYEMISLATPRVRTTVLSNAMVLRGRRLEKLLASNAPNLWIQVSVDDAEPGVHDLYRGDGSWRRAIDGIRLLKSAGVQVRVATTVTPELLPKLDRVRMFVRDTLGIPEADHIVRPLLKRGFAEAGLAVGKENLIPELTVDANGVYWHPAGTDADLQVTADTSSLRGGLEEIARALLTRGADGLRQGFR
ncbi:MAG TPA: radical SAM protein [Chloroflexota bacterium]|nr:radical SAM protein [Chloroflexota bacterium]